jgi:hypothetical protein
LSAAGGFLWAWRGASARAGFHDSPAEAADHYRKIGREVEAACAERALDCRSGAHAFLPRFSRGQLARAPRRAVQAARVLSFWDRSRNPVRWSRGSRAEFERMLDLVHRPAHLPLEGATPRVWIKGWYHLRGRSWFRAHLERPDGSVEALRIRRRPSPGLVAFFRDPKATHQRFEAEGSCDPRCTLVIMGEGRAEPVRIPLGRLAGESRGVAVGRAGLHLDQVEVESPGRAEATGVAAAFAFAGLSGLYRALLPPVLGLGWIAFCVALATALRGAGWEPLLVLAAVAWTGVATRIALVIAIDLTSFPAVRLQYLAPATTLALVAASVSIAVLVQHVRRTRGTRPASGDP